jgi:hypothetical protein
LWVFTSWYDYSSLISTSFDKSALRLIPARLTTTHVSLSKLLSFEQTILKNSKS